MSDDATASIFADMLLAELPKRLKMKVTLDVAPVGGHNQLAVDVYVVHRDPVTKQDTPLCYGQGRVVLPR